MRIGLKVLEGGEQPRYGTAASAAFDMTLPEDLKVGPWGYKNVRLNLIFKIPFGYYLQVRPRNSTFERYGLIFVGSGIIDEDYCGPEDVVGFPVWNSTGIPIFIPKGTRIAQGMVLPVSQVIFQSYDPTFTPSRGGTGSTGV